MTVRTLGWCTAGIAVAVALVWWGRPARSSLSPMPGADDGSPVVVAFGPDDPDIDAATARARETVGELIAVLEETGGRGIDAQVKVPIAEGDTVEHVWLEAVRYEDGMIHGSLASVPMFLRDWQRGDPTMVAPDEITDWLMIRGGALTGGFVLCVTRARMEDAERTELDRYFRGSFGARLESAWPAGCGQ